MVEGDVLYTLERPTGMDPQQFTAGFSGPRFDCAEAKTTADRLICADTGLSKSDRALAAAYTKLKAAELAESFATVQKAQRGWLDFAIKSCVGDAPMLEALGDRNVTVDCSIARSKFSILSRALKERNNITRSERATKAVKMPNKGHLLSSANSCVAASIPPFHHHPRSGSWVHRRPFASPRK